MTPSTTSPIAQAWWIVGMAAAIDKNHTVASSHPLLETALQATTGPVPLAAAVYVYQVVVHSFVPRLQATDELDDLTTLVVCSLCSAGVDDLGSSSHQSRAAAEIRWASLGRLVQASRPVRDLVQNLEWADSMVVAPNGQSQQQQQPPPLLKEVLAILRDASG